MQYIYIYIYIYINNHDILVHAGLSLFGKRLKKEFHQLRVQEEL